MKPEKPPVVRQGPAWALPKDETARPRPPVDHVLREKIRTNLAFEETPEGDAALAKLKPKKTSKRPKKTTLRDDL